MAEQPANIRADARRSRASILEAALRLLAADPATSMEAIAAAAGITRQTVYAHFPTRERLLSALLDRVTDEAVATMDDAGLDAGPAAEALLRLLDVSIRTTGRYAVLLQHLATMKVSPEEDRKRHDPVAERLRGLIERGRASGEFDARLPTDWLIPVTIELGHLAGEEVHAGRMTGEQALELLRISLFRIFGVEGQAEAER